MPRSLCPLLLALTTLATGLALEHEAHACAKPPTDPVAACADHVKIASGLDVPVNLGAFYWSPTFASSEIAEAGARLLRVDGATTEEIPFQTSDAVGGVWVQPSVPLVAGASYTFTRTAQCHFEQMVTRELTTSFRAGPAAPLGKSFGPIQVSGPVTKQTSYFVVATSCDVVPEEHPVTVRAVTLSPAASAPVTFALPFTPVYGVRLDGGDGRGHGIALAGGGLELQAYCGPEHEIANSPVAPGKHLAELYMIYPGSNEKVFSDPVEVDLSCPDSSTTTPSSAEAAPHADVASDASSGGCSLGRGASEGGTAGLAVAACALLVGMTRRRRSS